MLQRSMQHTTGQQKTTGKGQQGPERKIDGKRRKKYFKSRKTLRQLNEHRGLWKCDERAAAQRFQAAKVVCISHYRYAANPDKPHWKNLLSSILQTPQHIYLQKLKKPRLPQQATPTRTPIRSSRSTRPWAQVLSEIYQTFRQHF